MDLGDGERLAGGGLGPATAWKRAIGGKQAVGRLLGLSRDTMLQMAERTGVKDE